MGILNRVVRLRDGFLRLVTPGGQGGDVDIVEPPAVEIRFGYMRALVSRSLPDTDGGSTDLKRIDVDYARQLGYWPGQEQRPDFADAYRAQRNEPESLEQPWNYRWDALPKRSAGPGFSRDDYKQARIRAREVARATLGEALWASLQDEGYLDLPSGKLPGVTYRLRVGRRIEVLCAPGARSPWYFDFLCINPAYPLPEYEFFAHLYLYVRDQEEEVLRVAAPQPWDQALGRTF